MSTEDDIATIQAVTDKLVGPLKVWVLHIDDRRNGNEEHITAYYKLDNAVDTAQADMEDVLDMPLEMAKKEADALRTNHYVQVQGTEYLLKHVEVI